MPEEYCKKDGCSSVTSFPKSSYSVTLSDAVYPL
jgi:hypothetical protein